MTKEELLEKVTPLWNMQNRIEDVTASNREFNADLLFELSVLMFEYLKPAKDDKLATVLTKQFMAGNITGYCYAMRATAKQYVDLILFSFEKKDEDDDDTN